MITNPSSLQTRSLIHHKQTTYRTEIIAEYPNHIIYFTDGSRARSTTCYAYSIQDSITAKRIRNSASVFTAELSAIPVSHNLPNALLNSIIFYYLIAFPLSYPCKTHIQPIQSHYALTLLSKLFHQSNRR